MIKHQIVKIILGLLVVSSIGAVVFSDAIFGTHSEIAQTQSTSHITKNIPMNASIAGIELSPEDNSGGNLLQNGNTTESGIVAARRSDDKAANDLASLSDIDILHKYVERMSSYYYSNFKKSNFKYFGSKNYLANNPDVYIQAVKTKDPDEFALKHYLTYGIYEGRLSGSVFDPVVAVALSKNVIIDTLMDTESTPETLQVSFKAKTGMDTTEGYTVSVSSGDVEIASTPKSGWSTVSSIGSSYGSGGGSSSGVNSSDQSNPVAPDTISAGFVTTRAASLSKTLIPYIMYGDKNSGIAQNITLGDDVSGVFHGENYQTTSKPYTLMIYMTGSDQEMNNIYMRVSSQIVSMLKVDNLDNVNVLLCVGGTSDYQNTYLSKDIKDIGTGIYLINPDGLTTDQRNAIKNTTSEDLLTGLTDRKDDSQILSYNSLINSNTLIKLVTTEGIDMGDPALLAGFINFASELYPAADYGLILSDHGGGEMNGICFSESNDSKGIVGTSLETYEIEAALASTNICNNKATLGATDGKLGLLFFDACLMGSTEEAYAMKDYYRYMLGSEDETTSYTDYYTLLKAVNDSVGSSDASGIDDMKLASAVYDSFNATTWHRGSADTKDVSKGTMAIFSSDGISSTVNALNDFGIAVNNFYDTAGTDELITLFDAIRKSIMSCNDFSTKSSLMYSSYRLNEDCVDIGEFMTYLKNNLADIQATDIETQKLDNIKNSVDVVLNTGFLVSSCMMIDNGTICLDTANNTNNLITISQMSQYASNEWKALHPNSGYYGASLVLPLRMMSGGKNYLDSAEYTSDFEESDIKDYISFLGKYFAYYEVNLGSSDRINYLKSDMENVFENINSIITVEATHQYKVGEVEYITFKVAETYPDGITQSTKSFGTPMQDIMETAETIRLAITSDNETGRPVYSISNLDASTLDLDTSSINIDLDLLKSTIVTYWLKGTTQGGISTTSYYITPSYLEYSDDKNNAINVIVNGVIDCSKYNTFEGEAYLGTDYVEDLIHVFDENGKYVGTTKYSDTEENWQELKDISYIACYQYTIEEDANGNNKFVHFDINNKEYTDYQNCFFAVTGDTTASLNKGTLFGSAGKDINDFDLSISIDGTYYSDKASIDSATVQNTQSNAQSNEENVAAITEEETTEEITAVETVTTENTTESQITEVMISVDSGNVVNEEYMQKAA